MSNTIIIAVENNNSVIIGNKKGYAGRVHASHEDAMTIAWLLRDICIDKGIDVDLQYNW